MVCKDSSLLGQNDHHVLVDEATLRCTYTPGRKGGTFNLPLGAQLNIPESCFNKKDTISCHVASSETRWRHCPSHLPSFEHINSEIYTLKSPVKLKKSLVVQIPFKHVNCEFMDVNVKGKWTGEGEWVNVGFLHKEIHGKPCAELELTRLGTFVVTVTPKTETFDVTIQGLLYQARLSRSITVRFPKKGIDQSIQCALQIHPIPSEQIQLTRDQFPIETEHVTSLTEFVDVISNVQCKFKRAATVKLPLPVGLELDVEGGGDAATSAGHQDICVLYKSDATGWEVIETEYKFSRTTVTFDVKELTRYCVLQCIPGRQGKCREAVRLIEGRSNRDKGEVCLFLSLKPKSWKAVLEILPLQAADLRISDRKSQGYKVISRAQVTLPEPPQPVRFSNRRPPPPRLDPKKQPPKDLSFEIHEGVTWLVDVDGDVKVSQGADLRENNQLKYFSRLEDSYRTFHFEPMESSPKALEGSINLVPVGIRDVLLRNKMTFTFKVELDENIVSEYLEPDPVPEEPVVEKPKINLNLLPTTPTDAPAPAPSTPRIREIPESVMQRLTKPIRPVRVPERESRALTGKSLMTIARLIPEGLTLAVHLQLPDSTITGIGFDALSNNLNMSDVSYKILLYWKRKCKDKQMGAINQLTKALEEMGYQRIAEAVLEAHRRKKEFTPDMVTHEDLYNRLPDVRVPVR